MKGRGDKYKIAVIGPAPRDHIITFKGKLIEKYGCITYPVVLLSKLFRNNALIYPVSHIKKIDEPAIREILETLPGVNLSHLNSDADRGDVINLRFLDQNERVKTMSSFMNPIVKEDVEDLAQCDAFLFLPVTDFEITLETLKFAKTQSNGIVIFDAHGPTKTATILGDRLFKFWVDRDRWLPYIDILKMNLREAKCCAFKKRYNLEELEEDEPLQLKEIPKFAEHCFNLGVKALYITLDARGCLVYTHENGEVKEKLIQAVPINTIVDSTGCGDSFAGGLTFGLLTTGDYIEAAKYANALGAQCLQGAGFECFEELESTQNIINMTYGEKQWS